MQRHPLITKDGSYTIAIPAMKVTYHSIYGAIQESRHVFIEAGLRVSDALQASDVLEIGFGTGLNALLTLIEAEKCQRNIRYTAIELYPLEKQEIWQLNYCDQLRRPDLRTQFEQLHTCDWDTGVVISPWLTLHKIKIALEEYQASTLFDTIYFDAFAPSAQPELWTMQIFQKLFNMTRKGGILVTYCSKSDVRRAMQAAGFYVQKLTGPAGKREMLRARKM